MKSGIYQIRHVTSGKAYVGSTNNIKRRWNAHRWLLKRGKHHSVRLQNAWNKHGQTAFVFEIIEIVENPADLVAREQFFIDTLRVVVDGYNSRPKAESQLGRVVGRETREKLSRAASGKKHTPETRAAMSAALSGKPRPRSVEWNEKIAAALRGIKLSIEVRSAMADGQRKRAEFSEEHRKKLSLALTGRTRSESARQNMSAGQIGRKHSEETRARMSASQKLRRAQHAQ